jgi:hypothetical protein
MPSARRGRHVFKTCGTKALPASSRTCRHLLWASQRGIARLSEWQSSRTGHCGSSPSSRFEASTGVRSESSVRSRPTRIRLTGPPYLGCGRCCTRACGTRKFVFPCGAFSANQASRRQRAPSVCRILAMKARGLPACRTNLVSMISRRLSCHRSAAGSDAFVPPSATTCKSQGAS